MIHPLRQHIEEIIRLTDEEFKFILSHFKAIKRRKHQYIVQEGDIAKNEDFEMKIIGIDIMGKIAMVKLHVPMLGYNYYDYLSLVKVNKIMTIIYVLLSLNAKRTLLKETNYYL